MARQAIRAAGARRVDDVLAALARPDVADAAASSLAAFGERIMPLLDDALADATGSLAARREVPAVLVQIGTPGAARVLVAGLLDLDPALRHRVVASLNELKRRHPQMAVDGTAIELLLAMEIAGHYRAHQRPTSVRDSAVAAALRESMAQGEERIFRLLALLSPAGPVHDAYVGLRSPDAVIRANALEYLDNVLAADLRAVLVPLLDVHVTESERADLAARLLGALQVPADVTLATLLSSRDPWLRSRAEHAVQRASQAGEREHAPAPVSVSGDVGAG